MARVPCAALCGARWGGFCAIQRARLRDNKSSLTPARRARQKIETSNGDFWAASLAIPGPLEYIEQLMVRAYASYFGFTYRYWGFAL